MNFKATLLQSVKGNSEKSFQGFEFPMESHNLINKIRTTGVLIGN
jgi:hypothetical protein